MKSMDFSKKKGYYTFKEVALMLKSYYVLNSNFVRRDFSCEIEVLGKEF